MKKDKSFSSNVTRRKFIKVMGASTAGFMFSPTLLSKAFGASDEIATVATALLSTYDEAFVKKAVEQSFDNIGGLSDIIKPGDSVGLKINLTGGSQHAENYQDSSGFHPGDTYWTHPMVLKIVGQAVKDAGAGKLYILEALYDWGSVNNFGYKEVIDYLGATFIDLNEKDPYDDYIIKDVGEERLIYSDLTLNGIFNELDCFISLPKAKQHESAGITHGMKNSVGILPVPSGIYNDGQGHRAAIHNQRRYDNNKYNNLCRVLMDINRAVPYNLVVNDAIKTVSGSEGPWTSTGVSPAEFDTLIIGKDPVAVDSISTEVIGFDPMAADYNSPFNKSINYLKLASEQGLGQYDVSKIDVIDYVTDIENPTDRNVPNSIKLRQNYPNPFNPKTTIEFTLKKPMKVSLRVHNTKGQQLAVLFNGTASAGVHKYYWNAANYPSGTYFYTMKAGKHTETRRMLLVK